VFVRTEEFKEQEDVALKAIITPINTSRYQPSATLNILLLLFQLSSDIMDILVFLVFFCHQFVETAETLELHAKPRVLPPGITAYQETFYKDGRESSWMLRRDLRPGRSYGRMFMTSDNTIILR
jgi:hypothetical protein